MSNDKEKEYEIIKNILKNIPANDDEEVPYDTMADAIIDEHTAQDTMTNTEYAAYNMGYDPDWELAYMFQNYLTEKSNVLPKFDFIDEVIERKDAIDPESNIISAGYGAVVYNDDDGLKVESCEPIRARLLKETTIPLKDRYDLITADGNWAYTRTYNAKNPVEYTMHRVNIKKYPRFEEKRIKAVQSFLKSYIDYKNPIKGRNK